MKLTQPQKKYLRKNLKKLPLSQIAKYLSLSEEELKQYLKTTLPEDKYKKLFENNTTNKNISNNKRK